LPYNKVARFTWLGTSIDMTHQTLSSGDYKHNLLITQWCQRHLHCKPHLSLAMRIIKIWASARDINRYPSHHLQACGKQACNVDTYHRGCSSFRGTLPSLAYTVMLFHTAEALVADGDLRAHPNGNDQQCMMAKTARLLVAFFDMYSQWPENVVCLVWIAQSCVVVVVVLLLLLLIVRLVVYSHIGLCSTYRVG
jgi:hypothetical protein